MSLLYFKRRAINWLSVLLACAAMAAGLMCLLWILFGLIKNGLSGLSLAIFTLNTQPSGMTGGLKNALMGSIMIICYALLIGAPFGLMVGTYLAEFGKNNKLAKIIRFINDILLSLPSILLGLFIYQLVVVKMQHFSGWAGSLALSLLVIPIIARTTEDMFILVPNWLRESAFALGAPSWKVIFYIVLRISRTGVATGVLLALARISGETAPLLFTALNNQFWSTDMNRPMANLPLVMFQYATSPYEDWHQLAWTGALLITIAILSLNVVVRFALKQKPPLT
ncbi:MAG: phosphate ABC transporter permease PstA [Proteobacteria bacterium]|nr:phosphate ABC transporter permease PstA [Pseudomonadota bacterium]